MSVCGAVEPREAALNAPEPSFAAPVADPADIVVKIEALGNRLAQVRDRIGRVIFGQTGVIEQTLITLLGGGHALLDRKSTRLNSSH